ncbi:MAG TPA: 3-dehydroquinate synthase [Candidatus Baltobacteraceae bacterium]|nr:3-dehydroquinate synthase [Candidatus Baltobacteraceae bacterium]
MVAQEEDSHLALQPVAFNHDLEYPIAIGERLHVEAARFVGSHGSRVVVLHDANPAVGAVARRYARSLERDRVLGIAGFQLGERRKTLATVERVLERLERLGADRSTLIVGVGGGVASDLFGFAAATYMRGVAYAHVATSLVAMVDAAIGGKTGVDLPAGKNLAGAFSNPVAVFCEVSSLYTLPMRSVREGLAEVVKAAIIEGDDLFDGLETLSAHRFIQWPWTDLISAAVKVKTAIVADDRLEAGMRELLNLGHTFAHGIEAASEYRVTHGAAVALGLRAAGLLALRTGRFSEREHLRVLTLLTLFGMPLRTSVNTGAIFEAMSSDKKRRDGRLRFVLPRAIGDVEYGVECSDRTVRSVLGRLGQVPGAAKER